MYVYIYIYEYFPRELVRPVNSCSPKNPWGYETHRDFRWWNSPLCKGGQLHSTCGRKSWAHREWIVNFDHFGGYIMTHGTIMVTAPLAVGNCHKNSCQWFQAQLGVDSREVKRFNAWWLGTGRDGAPPRCGKYCGTKEIECNKKLFNQTYMKETAVDGCG